MRFKKMSTFLLILLISSLFTGCSFNKKVNLPDYKVSSTFSTSLEGKSTGRLGLAVYIEKENTSEKILEAISKEVVKKYKSTYNAVMIKFYNIEGETKFAEDINPFATSVWAPDGIFSNGIGSDIKTNKNKIKVYKSTKEIDSSVTDTELKNYNILLDSLDTFTEKSLVEFAKSNEIDVVTLLNLFNKMKYRYSNDAVNKAIFGEVK